MSDPISMGLAGLSSLNTALQISKTISDARDTTKLLSVKLELQGAIMEAQQAQMALVAEKRELEERVRQLEAWDGEKERYHLADVGNGCLAYALKPDATPAEPPHSLCAQCYQQGRKSILVPFHITAGNSRALQCHACGSEMVIQGRDLRESNRLAARRPSPRGGSPRVF